jgi:hypothetical protein
LPAGEDRLCAPGCAQRVEAALTSLHYPSGVYLHVTFTVVNTAKEKVNVNSGNVRISSNRFTYEKVSDPAGPAPFADRCTLGFGDSCKINLVYKNLSFAGSARAFERIVKAEEIEVLLNGLLVTENNGEIKLPEKKKFYSTLRGK